MVVKELKRIVESSEITKSVFLFDMHVYCHLTMGREDDTNWPKKNIVGKQELEIRVGNDHIAFEVRLSCLTMNPTHRSVRPRKLVPSSIFKIARTPKVSASFIILSRT